MTKLVGFSIWRGRFFDLLRAVHADDEPVKRVKTWILGEYRAAAREVA